MTEECQRNIPASNELLDLSFLNQNERKLIHEVLAKDASLHTEDQIRLGTLRQRIEVARSHQKELLSAGQCTVCEKGFWFRFFCSKQCPLCNYKVCKNCRHQPMKPPPDFMCLVCYETGVLNIQSALGESSGTLYGSELVRASLKNFAKEVSPEQSLTVNERDRSHSLTLVQPELTNQNNEDSSGYPVVHTLDPTPNSGNHDKPLPAKRVTEPESDDEEEQRKPEPYQSSTLPRSGSMGSFTSTMSLYSAAGGTRGDYEITGEVLLGVELQGQQLLIHINRARGLAAANQKNLSNPYIKTYLLPDRSKRSKRKTKPKRKTVDPVYDEILKYKLRDSDCSSLTLWVSVWDYDKFGRNRFLGEVYLQLDTMDLTDPQSHWYRLMDQQPKDLWREVRGSVRVGLMFKPNQGRGATVRGDIYVTIHCARLIATPPPDAFLICHLLPDQRRIDRLKTSVITHSSTPMWNEEMVFASVSIEELTKERVLELTMWDYNKRYGSDFLGGLRLGPFAPKQNDWMDCIGEEVAHWKAMLTHHGKWVESWHPLRSNMDPRDIDQMEVGGAVQLPPPISEVTEEEETRGEPTQATRLPPDIIIESESEEEEEKQSVSPEQSEDEDSEGVFTLRIPIMSHSVSDSSLGSYASSTSSKELHKGDYEISGKVLVAVELNGENLLIHVNKAEGLAAADKNGLSDPYVKTYLLPERRTSKWKRKTALKKKTLNPEYNETLKYKLPSTDIARYTIWLSVWDHDVFGKNSFLGEVFIPLSKLDLDDTCKQWHILKDHSHYSHSESTQAVQQATAKTTNGTTQPSATDVPRSTESLPRGVTGHPPIIDDHGENLLTVQSHPSVSKDGKQEVPIIIVGEQSATLPSETGMKEPHSESTSTPGMTSKHINTPLDQVRGASYDSSLSLESSMEIHKGSYEISGEVLVGVEIKEKVLLIRIGKAMGLAAVTKSGLSDPYVKTYLLPDTSQRSKRKTAIKKKTTEPVYNETLKYNIASTDYSTHVIWLSVWNYDRFGRNSFLGEIHLPLSSLNLTDSQQHWYPLQDRVVRTDEQSSQSSAELEIALCITPDVKDTNLCSLAVEIKQARNLALLRKKPPANVYVKCYLLPDRTTSSKRRTGVCAYHPNSPTTWNEKLTYEKLNQKKLSEERVLEVSVWSSHRGSSNEVIGRFCLGPSSAQHKECTADQNSHWEEMLSKPSEWITHSHPLKDTAESKT